MTKGGPAPAATRTRKAGNGDGPAAALTGQPVPITNLTAAGTAGRKSGARTQQERKERRRKTTAHPVPAAQAAESVATPLAPTARRKPKQTRTPMTAGGGQAGPPDRKERRGSGETTSGHSSRTPGLENRGHHICRKKVALARCRSWRS